MTIYGIQYITFVWETNPQFEMSLRSVKEIRTLTECLDTLLSGEIPVRHGLLMQRLKVLK